MERWLFDEFADAYDRWFMQNENVLLSEVLLVRRALQDCGETLSVGCGSGLFEQILRSRFALDIRNGAEPSEAMARIAGQRGMQVRIAPAEQLMFPDGAFDTVLMNGVPSYLVELAPAFREARRVLKQGGHLVVLDVGAEGSYGLLYRLAGHLGSWDHPQLQGCKPEVPYPLELAAHANWRTTPAKIEVLLRLGFGKPETFQTLTRHPAYSNKSVEEPCDGFDRGDYVAIRAEKV
jgi:SAM-dependent methyltransferase